LVFGLNVASQTKKILIMKKTMLIALMLLLFQGIGLSQKSMNFQLKDAVVVGLFDRKDEHYQMEIFLSEILNQYHIHSTVSMNFLKEGADVKTLASDSTLNAIKAKGYDMFILMDVRGYDQRFKPSTERLPLEKELSLGHLFPMYREEVSSVSFEFKFYRGTEMVGYDIIKVGAGSKDAMLKKLRAKIEQRIKSKIW